ncbi:hypothetical protein DDB_G0283109 [Dictyostelium discoideum AX4]|uniref:Probable serine/threonine-protein kinase iksA n=1 Tax=Dictyostelium discoideum TaxID=44689 RepID=IKSA_DICDI|nr:hypothetical protein DDB_G0283109 [Dictyostelium discoideum AX4]Q54RJ4.1 RecName: Full=Probable serine/threonine-protein kinase iksA; AltName: Full=Ira1 kinase suppressor protein A [Dictyostelium discoideum]EAL65884.1 hypothetical protein DDB_G0283109 [Dictyostelium discoideum AX4]|eukprot:XP_639242.1 hypothetical protein DDB_G0283109 [Dictyostelium discoideum AX4]
MEEDKYQLVLHNDDLERMVLYDPNSKSLLVRNSTDMLRQKSKQLVLQQQIESPYSPMPSLRSPSIPTTPTLVGGLSSQSHNNNHPSTLHIMCPYCKRSYNNNNNNNINNNISTNNNNINNNSSNNLNNLNNNINNINNGIFNNNNNNNSNSNNNNISGGNNNTMDINGNSIVSGVIAPFNPSPYYRSPISEPPFISRDYFLLLQDSSKSGVNNNNNNNNNDSTTTNNNNNNNTTPPQQQQQQNSSGLNSEFLNIGYYKKFFKEDIKIGSGGFGSVYLCRHLINGVDLGEFAVKKVPVGENLPWLFRVLREVKALETLTKHRNIINYKHSWLEYDQPADFGPKVPCLYILMEYANNGNLQDYMAEKRDLIPENEIWSFFIDLCHGIGYLHHSGIIHRDIKPPNILIHQSYDSITDREVTHLMISDFGTCDTIGPLESLAPPLYKNNIKRTGNTGTIEYLAPELLQKGVNGEYNSDYDEKCDIWSLGILLYQMAYGTLPYRYSGDPFIDEDPNRNLPSLIDEIAGFSNNRLIFPQIPQRSRDLKDMITILLRAKPHERPTISQILSTHFIQSKTKHYTINPIHLPFTKRNKFKNTSVHNTTASTIKLRRKGSISTTNSTTSSSSSTATSSSLSSTTIATTSSSNAINNTTATTTTNSNLGNNNNNNTNALISSRISPIRKTQLVEENSEDSSNEIANINPNRSLIQPIVLSDTDNDDIIIDDDDDDDDSTNNNDTNNTDNTDDEMNSGDVVGIVNNKKSSYSRSSSIRSPSSSNKLRQRTISNSGGNNGIRKALPSLEAPRSGRFKRAAIVIQRGVRSSAVYQAFYMLQALFQVWLCFDQCSTCPNTFPSPILLYPLLLLSLIPILVVNNNNNSNNMNNNNNNNNINSNGQLAHLNGSGGGGIINNGNRDTKKINTIISIIRFIYYFVISVLLPKEISCKSTSHIIPILPPIADYVVFPLLSLFKNLTLLIINLIFIFYRD